MMRKTSNHLRAMIASLAVAATPFGVSVADERQSLEELRNTVINLLQTLVDQGVITKEKASQLVKQAQDKATADAAAVAKTDEGAVRVPYVPQIVKDEISKQVAAEVKPAVVADVVQEAKTEKWGVPGARPIRTHRRRPCPQRPPPAAGPAPGPAAVPASDQAGPWVWAPATSRAAAAVDPAVGAAAAE